MTLQLNLYDVLFDRLNDKIVQSIKQYIIVKAQFLFRCFDKLFVKDILSTENYGC